MTQIAICRRQFDDLCGSDLRDALVAFSPPSWWFSLKTAYSQLPKGFMSGVPTGFRTGRQSLQATADVAGRRAKLISMFFPREQRTAEAFEASHWRKAKHWWPIITAVNIGA